MGDWFNAELTIHPEGHEGVRVHRHELDHLRREGFIRTGEDDAELVTEIEDENRGGEEQAPDPSSPSVPNSGASKTDLTKDGTASKTGPKTTSKE